MRIVTLYFGNTTVNEIMNYTEVITPPEAKASNIFLDGKPSRKFKWVAEIEIDEFWVMDGLNLNNDRLQEILLSHFGYARSDEIKVKIIAEPDPNVIMDCQGYE